MFHIFAYLKKYHGTTLVFYPSDPCVEESDFEIKDYISSEFGHLQGTEELPPNMPQPRGLGFIMSVKVDSHHASDTVTRQSKSDLPVQLNLSLINCSSRKQNSVELTSFGLEFIVMKQCCEYLRDLRYKLRMMGIP